jgi:hypothetical protein
VGAGIAGCLAGPAALAQPASPAGGEPAAPGDDVRNAIARRAGELDQFHSLVVAQGGEIAFAEAFRGPPVDRPVNIKSVSKTVVAALVGAGLHPSGRTDRGTAGQSLSEAAGWRSSPPPKSRGSMIIDDYR